MRALLIRTDRDVPKRCDITHLLRLLGPRPGLDEALTTSPGDPSPWAISGRYPLPGDRQAPDATEIMASLALLDRLRAALDATLAESA